jgi:hypothetical protein
MLNLFLHTLSQGLQAFVPIAAALAWFERNDRGARQAIRRGVALSAPATVAAAWAFKTSAARALEEAALAVVALAVATLFLFCVWRRDVLRAYPSHRTLGRPVASAIWLAAILIVVRQTMEIGTTFAAAAFDVRSLDATAATVGATALSAGVAWLWTRIARHLPTAQLHRATRTFAVVFVLQLLVYAFHESAEARLLPWSGALHAATEPYGPDGVFGMHFSELLVVLPIAAGLIRGRRGMAIAGRSVATIVALGIAALALLQASPSDEPAPPQRPHLLFRETSPGAAFGTLSVVPLDHPEAARMPTGFSCERVSFGGSSGLCLHAERTLFGLFVSYSAVPIDGALKPRGKPIKLEGRPSRTRVAPNGRLGAVTVFVVGDDYAAEFSTRTTLIDLSSGSTVADLEQFATFRNAEPFSARDFNFWGVTFAADGDLFYASLRTGGATYLVRGSVASRRMAVLRENVECPSVSPDNRLIAFKKHVGPDPGAWRLAVLNVATMDEHLIAGETRYIDDQVQWLDAGHILYSVPRRTTNMSDVWMVDVDSDLPAKIFLPQAESPIVVR